MKKHIIGFLVLISLCIPVLAQSEKEQASIRKIMDDQTAAWNRGDIDAFMSIGYWQSEKLKFVSGYRITYGWKSTLDNYKTTYSSTALMGKLTFSGLEIDVLSKDAAFVIGSWSLARDKDNPKGKVTLLFRKGKEGWRIVTDHSS